MSEAAGTEGGGQQQGAGQEATGQGKQQQGQQGQQSQSFTQADVDRIVSERLARQKAQFADYDDLKSKAEQFAALERASQTEHERALADAQTAREKAEKALSEQTAKYGAQLVRAHVTAAAAGRMSDEQRVALLEGLDTRRYLTDDGEVDEKAIAKLIDGLAPQTGADLGQGRRGGAPKSLDMNALIRQAAGRQ